MISWSPAQRPMASWSPAQRLGFLYIASLSAIALIWVLGQWLVLRELQREWNSIQRLSQAAQARWSTRSLSEAALGLLASGSGQRAEVLKSLEQRIEEAGRGPKETSKDEAIASARALAALASEPGVTTASLRPLIDATVMAEEQHRRTLDSYMTRTEGEATARMERLRLLESLLGIYVVIVLILEGMFVVIPAIRGITRHTEELARSNALLRSYADRLEQSNKELQEFASVASHDLQEPLRKVQAFSDRLRRKYADKLDEQGLDHLGRIQNAAERMQKLINDLLTYSRVTTKAQPFAPVDLAVVVREVTVDLEARIESSGGRVEVEALPTIDADALQVRQLFQNLIGNALKYHRRGVQPLVKVSARPLLPEEPVPANGQAYVRIDVSDNGIGFEDQYKDRIFQMFQRLHGREEYEGTGVGLAVCRKIVDRHGGSITARGVPGDGATFELTLPVTQPLETTSDA
jgi:signal transduction histidine kinase